MIGRALAGVLVWLLCEITAVHARDAPVSSDWLTYHNDRYGFSLDYPSNVFQSARGPASGDGQIFISHDGDARLLVGALSNNDRFTPAAYQNYITKKSYANFAIKYGRLTGDSFVLSGEGKGEAFYQKVIFSCNRRRISSFAVIYPSDRRRFFDPIVAGVEKSFRPGTLGCTERLASTRRHAREAHKYPRSAFADQIARARGRDVLVVLRRTSPPHDYKIVRGYGYTGR